MSVALEVNGAREGRVGDGDIGVDTGGQSRHRQA